MPVAKIHVLEGRYDEARLGKVSSAVQNGLVSVLGIPPEDFFQIIHVLPRSQFLHTPSFIARRGETWLAGSPELVRGHGLH